MPGQFGPDVVGGELPQILPGSGPRRKGGPGDAQIVADTPVVRRRMLEPAAAPHDPYPGAQLVGHRFGQLRDSLGQGPFVVPVPLLGPQSGMQRWSWHWTSVSNWPSLSNILSSSSRAWPLRNEITQRVAAVSAATAPAGERTSRSGIGACGPTLASRVCRTKAAPPTTLPLSAIQDFG